MHQVEASDLQVFARVTGQQLRVQVSCQYAARGRNAIREPDGETASPEADFEAAPALGDAQALDEKA
jgi:hypothetical protein